MSDKHNKEGKGIWTYLLQLKSFLSNTKRSAHLKEQ